MNEVPKLLAQDWSLAAADDPGKVDVRIYNRGQDAGLLQYNINGGPWRDLPPGDAFTIECLPAWAPARVGMRTIGESVIGTWTEKAVAPWGAKPPA